MKHTIKSMLISAGLLAAGAAAQADQLSFAGGWPPGAAPNTVLENYGKAIGENSGGDLTMRLFPLSLLNFKEANAGLRDGLADMAVILTPYFPADFPNLNMVSEFSELVELPEFAGDLSSAALAGAITEFVMLNCPDCLAEVEAQNQVYMGASMSTSYVMQCAVPITSPEELKGVRIRAAGAYWARWAETVGAVPVSMSINETFEALNQGVLDCTASNTADFINYSFVDVVKHVYVGLPGGQFTIPAMINKDRWNGLSDEGKSAIMRANAQLAADMTWVYVDDGRNGREEAAKRGIEYGAASDSLLQMNRDFIAKDVLEIASIYKERFGLTSGIEASDAIRELLVRWTELTANVANAAELAEIYNAEIYSKIDLSTYGK